MELKFERERLVANNRRTGKANPTLNISELPALPKNAKQVEGKSVAELMATVDQLSKVIEKLKLENQELKRTAAHQVKSMEAEREVKKLRKELDRVIDETKNVSLYMKQSAR